VDQSSTAEGLDLENVHRPGFRAAHCSDRTIDWRGAVAGRTGYTGPPRPE
jgi:hypothetical protein